MSKREIVVREDIGDGPGSISVSVSLEKLLVLKAPAEPVEGVVNDLAL